MDQSSSWRPDIHSEIDCLFWKPKSSQGHSVDKEPATQLHPVANSHSPLPHIFFHINSKTVIPPKRRSLILCAYLISTAHYRYFANGERIKLFRLSAYSTQQECKKPFSRFTHTDENADLTTGQYDWYVNQNRWLELILFPQRITEG